jgi:ribosomal protein L29
LQSSIDRKSSELKSNSLNKYNHNQSELESHNISREPSIDKREFLKQIDKEYSSTGAGGFLRLNGLFSSHVNKKLNLDSEFYHSMNMLSQKRTILNKLRKSIANVPTLQREKSLDIAEGSPRMFIEKNPNHTMDNADRKTMDSTSINSSKNKSTLMYKRCSKLENWKDFQTKRSPNQFDHSHHSVASTLPVLKFHKQKLFRQRGSLQGRRSKERSTML